MSKKIATPSKESSHQTQSNLSTNQPSKKIKWGGGSNRQARIWFSKYLLDNINDKKALTDPQGCFELTGTKAIQNESSIKLIQIYDAVSILRSANCEDFVLNLPANPNDLSLGRKKGFYYIPDKYRSLAMRAVNEALKPL